MAICEESGTPEGLQKGLITQSRISIIFTTTNSTAEGKSYHWRAAEKLAVMAGLNTGAESKMKVSHDLLQTQLRHALQATWWHHRCDVETHFPLDAAKWVPRPMTLSPGEAGLEKKDWWTQKGQLLRATFNFCNWNTSLSIATTTTCFLFCFVSS